MPAADEQRVIRQRNQPEQEPQTRTEQAEAHNGQQREDDPGRDHDRADHADIDQIGDRAPPQHAVEQLGMRCRIGHTGIAVIPDMAVFGRHRAAPSLIAVGPI